MKILMIGGYPLAGRVSGSLAHAGNLARYLSAIDGTEVHVITLGDKNERFTSGQVNVHVVSKSWFFNLFLLPFALRTIKRRIDEINPDVIHAMRGFPYFAIAASLRRNYPVLLTVFSLSRQELRFDKNLLWVLLRVFIFIPVERYAIPRISDIIVQTRFMEGLVGRMTKSRMHIVPEGIEYAKLQQFKSTSLLSEPPDIFVAVGFRKLKGIDVLIKAVPIVVKSVPDLKLSIAGSGEEEANLKKLVKELAVEDNVEFLGFIADEAEKFRHYNACKLVVVPSRWDNEPFAPLDGAIVGKPAIVSEAANSSLVVDGQTGFVFQSENVEQLAAKITELLTDDKLRERMGKAIGEKVKEYDWPVIAGSTLSVYRQVIADFRGRGSQNK